jgi:hypothetical protein
MDDKATVHPEPSDVTAVDGSVQVDGPDAVAVAMTPEAAEETSDRLAEESVRARGQRRLGRIPHQPKR